MYLFAKHFGTGGEKDQGVKHLLSMREDHSLDPQHPASACNTMTQEAETLPQYIMARVIKDTYNLHTSKHTCRKGKIYFLYTL